MGTADDLRDVKLALNNGSGSMPASSASARSSLIPWPPETRRKAAPRSGSAVPDTAERDRTEREVGEGMREAFAGGKIKCEDVFVITKLWNTNHRPELRASRPSRPASRNSSWTTSICISFTRPSLSSPATTKTRVMPTAT